LPKFETECQKNHYSSLDKVGFTPMPQSTAIAGLSVCLTGGYLVTLASEARKHLKQARFNQLLERIGLTINLLNIIVNSYL